MPCRDMHTDKPPGRGHQEGAAAAGRVEYGRLLPGLKKLSDCIARRRRKNGRREIGRQRLAAIVTAEERISAGDGIVAQVGVQATGLPARVAERRVGQTRVRTFNPLWWPYPS